MQVGGCWKETADASGCLMQIYSRCKVGIERYWWRWLAQGGWGWLELLEHTALNAMKRHIFLLHRWERSHRNIGNEKKKKYHIPPNTIGKLQHLVERRTYNEKLYFSAAFWINLNNCFGFESFDQAMDWSGLVLNVRVKILQNVG